MLIKFNKKSKYYLLELEFRGFLLLLCFDGLCSTRFGRGFLTFDTMIIHKLADGAVARGTTELFDHFQDS